MRKELLSRQLSLFLMTGGLAAAANFGSRIAYNRWMSFSSAVVLAYLTGMLIAYILAKLLVFKRSQQSLARSIFFFVLINVIAVLQTWGISLGLVLYLFPAIGFSFFEQELAHAIGIIVPVFSSYFGHKYFSFKEA